MNEWRRRLLSTEHEQVYHAASRRQAAQNRL